MKPSIHNLKTAKLVAETIEILERRLLKGIEDPRERHEVYDTIQLLYKSLVFTVKRAA